MKKTRVLILLVTGTMMIGCTASVKEQHYFASFNKMSDTPTRPVNFYRLNVRGTTQFSSARYLAGFYDERAVDMFFNEMRVDKDDKSTLFKVDLKEPGTNDAIQPLSPSPGNGAFVLILSTSADSIANAIGSFAESEVVAESITNLVAKEKIKEKIKSDAAVTVETSRGKALESQLNNLFEDAMAQTDSKASKKAYLRILSALGRALGYDNSFLSFDEARKWFQLERNVKGE